MLAESANCDTYSSNTMEDTIEDSSTKNSLQNSIKNTEHRIKPHNQTSSVGRAMFAFMFVIVTLHTITGVNQYNTHLETPNDCLTPNHNNLPGASIITSLIVSTNHSLQRIANIYQSSQPSISNLHPHHHHRIVTLDRRTGSGRHVGAWSPANIELIQAAAKVAILVGLKIVVKYYAIGPLKLIIGSGALLIALDLASKAVTIALAKFAMKLSLYPALRTATKTLLIAAIKCLFQPISARFKFSPVQPSGKAIEDIPEVRLLVKVHKFLVTLSVKTIIKIVALLILLQAFESEVGKLCFVDLVLRVATILAVKLIAKKACKQYLKRYPELKNDKLTMFAIKKLVTKLIKIPLIKFLF